MKEYTVMFVDIVDSTKLKYEIQEENAFVLVHWLFKELQKIAPHGVKFTGDGGMMVYTDEKELGKKVVSSCIKAVYHAENIIQKVDRLNFSFINLNNLSEDIINENAISNENLNKDIYTGSDVKLQVRIGIASGKSALNYFSSNPLDVIGTVPDLAARLCSEADKDGILIDQTTSDQIKDFPPFNGKLKPCKRRLQLKGISKNATEEYNYFIPERLVRIPSDSTYEGGVIKLFPNRASLKTDFADDRLIRLAEEGSEILAAGRTLIYWANLFLDKDPQKKDPKEDDPKPTTIFFDAIRKKLKINFLISSLESSERYLDDNQSTLIKNDHQMALRKFNFLRQFNELATDGFKLVVKETEHLFLDGMIYTQISLPTNINCQELFGTENGDLKNTKIVLQDINATENDNYLISADRNDDPKSTLLLACICKSETKRKKACRVCGLHDRTKYIFDKSNEINND